MSEYLKAWQEEIHASHFDGWYNLNSFGLKKTYESFNEVKLFVLNKHKILGKNLLEIGCATGEFYRYLTKYHNDINYHGLDISEPAIKRAKTKYPMGNFTRIEESKPIPNTITDLGFNPSIIFARDVVIHQPNPFEFLQDIISIPSELIILRIRTRDNGPTELNTDLSCQWHYGKWVPYMIMNVDEVIDAIKSAITFDSLCVYKSYIQLGGYGNRFLPKDCFYPDTGTAETAISIQKLGGKGGGVDIFVKQCNESKPFMNVYHRKVLAIINKIKK